MFNLNRVAAAFILLIAAASATTAAEAASQITVAGTVAQNCTINVTPNAGAASLNLTGGVQHVTIGTILQNCNKKAGYSMNVTSANCATAPTGAKLIGSAGGETLVYSAETQNATTGGSSAIVTGLLASSCTNQIARSVTNAKIDNETSTLIANFTGNSALGADTYQDILTVTIVAN